jgi:hypothetical protein
MKKTFLFLLCLWLLTACGAPAASKNAKSTSQAQNIPLPGSELTRTAPAAENVAAETVSPTRTSRSAAKAKKTATPPATPTQVLIATIVLPTSEPAGEVPTAMIPSQPEPLLTPSSVAILPLTLNQPAVQIETPGAGQVPPTVATNETVIPPTLAGNEDIIQPKATGAGSTSLPFFFFSGIACLTGVLILIIGITMAYSTKPSIQQITTVLNISDLQPGLGWVQLQGKITQVPHPLDKNDRNPLAVLRLVIEENDIRDGWKVVFDKTDATEFSLEDGTGAVWIHPGQIDLSLLGEGAFASINQAEEALKILGLQPNSAWGRGLRYRIWELRSGQRLVAVGNLEQRFILSGVASQSLALSPTEEGAQPLPEVPPPSSSRYYLTILVFAIAAAAILVGIATLIWILLR